MGVEVEWEVDINKSGKVLTLLTVCMSIQFGVMRVGKQIVGSDSFMHALNRGTSLIRKRLLLGLYRSLPKAPVLILLRLQS